MTKKELKTIKENARTYYAKRELTQIEIIRENNKDKKDELIYNYAYYDGIVQAFTCLYKALTGEDIELIKIIDKTTK